MQFTWVPFYKELAAKLLPFSKRSDELVDIAESALSEVGLEVGWLQDRDADGNKYKLRVIDPFTFFATFNRGITETKRIEILKTFKKRFGVNAALPSDFAGIPVVNNQNSLFCQWEESRSADHIKGLWNLARECVEGSPASMSADAYEAAAGQIGASKLTVGLFWLNPEQFLWLYPDFPNA